VAILGVDVSEHQGRPDWGRARGAGIGFAIAKVSEGTTYKDRSYAYNRDTIRAAGLVPGGYHFLVNTSPAVSQADAFAAVVDPHAIHALDVEKPGLDVPGWVARYRSHYPHHPLVIYTGRYTWPQAVGALNGAQYGALWVAGAAVTGYVPGSGSLADLFAKLGPARGGLPWAGWTTAAFVQFTDKAQVPGVDGPVDGDAFLGDQAALTQLTGDQQPQEDSMPTADEVATAVLHRLAAAPSNPGDTDANGALNAIMRTVWTAAWPAGTPQDPKRVETAQDRLVWASRQAAIAGDVAAVKAAVEALGTPAALAAAIAVRLPAGGVDPKVLAAAFADVLAARLAQ